MEFYLERLDRKGGGRLRLPGGAVSIGRSPKNTIALSTGERCVSGFHAVIYADRQRLLLQDVQSTNGTFVNGRQVQECVLEEGDEIGLGRSGPRFRVVGEGEAPPAGFGGVGVPDDLCDDETGGDHYDDVNDVDDADDSTPADATEVAGGQYGDEYPSPLPPSSTSKPKIIGVAVLIGALAVLGLLASLMFSGKPSPETSKSPSDKKIFFSLDEGGSSTPSSQISTDTESEGDDADAAAPTPSPSVSAEERINAILTRFGENEYRAPPEMVERVEHYLGQYTGGRRRTIAGYMERGRRFFPMIRRIFEEKNIPLELAYVSMLESGFDTRAVSHAGAVGLWQFMPTTARNYGLRVAGGVDERTDPEKATYAAAAYFKDLIAIFGSRSAVMLCMAAYNAGETRVINALKRIDDPVRDRDFWYLYRMGWLAEETNEYIPQVIALMIVSEHPEEYGFSP